MEPEQQKTTQPDHVHSIPTTFRQYDYNTTNIIRISRNEARINGH